METFREFVHRQRKFVTQIKWPPGTRFECRRCGDCCTWNFWNFRVPLETLELIKRESKSSTHGNWILLKNRLRCALPIRVDENEYKEFIFSGLLPPDHLEFLEVTGRFHGYWVLNENDRIVVYSPVKCIHLTDEGLCGIYMDRPRVCQVYICRRYPVIS